MKPRLLDLFCGAGGAAMGYHRAGFQVVGVDIKPQPRYPFEFHLADALDFLGAYRRGYVGKFNVINASPPCQAYTVANNIHGREHPDLLPATRDGLIKSGIPWVIENVPGAPMRHAVVCCGLAFGLNVKRHRFFESSELILTPPCPGHAGDWLLVFGHSVLHRAHVSGRAKGGGPILRRKEAGIAAGRAAMGIDWMTRAELSEAIPPAYTEFIGAALLKALNRAA
jgi:DNA (cytosine-5)-methyltransferase 1